MKRLISVLVVLAVLVTIQPVNVAAAPVATINECADLLAWLWNDNYATPYIYGSEWIVLVLDPSDQETPKYWESKYDLQHLEDLFSRCFIPRENPKIKGFRSYDFPNVSPATEPVPDKDDFVLAPFPWWLALPVGLVLLFLLMRGRRSGPAFAA